MDFKEYSRVASGFAFYPGSEITRSTQVHNGLLYCCLGLGSETGELQGKLKKAMRDNNHSISEDLRQAMIAEIGDVLWYLSEIAGHLEITLEQVAVQNIEKLAVRQQRGTLGGNGDNR